MNKSSIFYNYSSLILNYLKETSHNLSVKKMELFKIIISITPIVIGIGYYSLPLTPTPLTLILFCLSIICFLITLLYGISILRPTVFKLTEPYKFYMEFFDLESSELLEQLAVDLGDDCKELNDALIDDSEKISRLTYLFALTLILLFVSYVSIFIHC